MKLTFLSPFPFSFSPPFCEQQTHQPQPTPTHSGSLMDQIISGSAPKSRSSISGGSTSRPTFTAQHEEGTIFNPTPTRGQDGRVATLNHQHGEGIARPASVVEYGRWHGQELQSTGAPQRSHSVIPSGSWHEHPQQHPPPPPPPPHPQQGYQYASTSHSASAVYDGYLQVQQGQPPMRYHPSMNVSLPHQQPGLQRHHSQHLQSGPHMHTMMRSYSDPFARDPPTQDYQLGYVISPSQHAEFAEMQGMNTNIGVGAGIGGVAMGNIVGPPPPTAYHTPVRYGPGGELASASKSFASTSPFDSSSEASTSVRKTMTNDGRPMRDCMETPASSTSYGSGSSYHPSAQKRRLEDDDEEEGDYVVDQGSPTRASSKGIVRGGRMKPQMNGRNMTVLGGSGARPTRMISAPAPSAPNANKKGGKAVTPAAVAGSGTAASASSSTAGGPKDDYLPENLPHGERSTEKPGVSYAAIIGQAILASSKKRLSLAQIYAWISAAYPYFRPGDAGWQNSIRHNLSLNECFVKAQRTNGEASGKGSYWMIKEELEYQFEGGNFKKGNGRPKALPKKKAGSSKNSTPVLPSAMLTPMQSSSPHVMTMSLQHELQQMPPPPPPPIQTGGQGIVIGPYGMIAHQPQHVMMPPPHMPITNLKKRKSSETEFADDENMTSSAPALQHQPSLPPPPLQDSPILASAATSKRAKLETAEGWSTPAPTTSNRPPPLNRKHSSNQVGIMSVDESSRRNDRALRPPISSSPSVGYAPERLRVDRSSPEPPATSSTFHPAPLALLERAAMQSQMHRMDIDEDEYSTPQKPIPANTMITSSSLSAIPHLTPSASSPVTSPAPPTITRGGGTQLRRTQMYQAATAVDLGLLNDDIDEMIKIAGDSDTSDEGETSRVDPMIAKRAMANGGASQMGRKAQLGPAVVFATPAVPSKVKQTERLSEMEPEFEHVTLSPMTTRQSSASGSKVSLPGPSELLSSSPRACGLRNISGDRDMLALLDRAPSSPLSKSNVSKEDYSTPGASARSTRVTTVPRHGSVTPLRSSVAFNHINNETPAGLSKMAYQAEHRSAETPKGMLGSFFDIGDTGYLLEQELDLIRSQTAHSPTGAHAKKGSFSSPWGGGNFGKMLWPTRSP